MEIEKTSKSRPNPTPSAMPMMLILSANDTVLKLKGGKRI
jgi:hypothetical protein